MTLTLELGFQTVEQLKAGMLHSELLDWVAYGRKRLLPGRRLEYYLAHLAQCFKGGRLSDHLLGAEEEVAEEVGADDGAAAFAMAGGTGKVVRIGLKRKRKVGGI